MKDIESAAAENESAEKAEQMPVIETFSFQPGTIIKIGETALVLTDECEIPFAGAYNEQFVVGLLSISKNLDVNRSVLRGKYDGFGILIEEPAIIETPEENAVDEEPEIEYLRRRVSELEMEKSDLGTTGKIAPESESSTDEDSEMTSDDETKIETPNEVETPEQVETSDQSEDDAESTEEVETLDIEDLVTEDHLRADLKAKTVPELKTLAKELEIALPRGAKEDEIIETIVKNVGTREAMEKILEAAK